MAKNYYVILSISRDESPAGIPNAYHQLARYMHPDLAGPDGTSRFHEINQAYEVLSDPALRNAHDRELAELIQTMEVQVRQQMRAWPIRQEPISLFGQPEQTRPSFDAFHERYLRNFTQWRVPKAERPESLTLDVALSPAEAFHGCAVPVAVPVFRTCWDCGGTGHVFPFHCLRCGGTGLLEEERTLHLRVPPRVPAGTVLELPLDLFGIRNLYLRLQVSISDAP